MNKNTYVSKLFEFTDKIVRKKRNEIFHKIKESVNLRDIESILDIGTTTDDLLKSSNFIIYKFKDIKIRKSISNQKLNNNFFNLNITKSITEKLSETEIQTLSCFQSCSFNSSNLMSLFTLLISLDGA